METFEEFCLNERMSMSDMGHMALDVVGLIPAVGNIADVANVLWYAKKKEYLMAGISLLSAIPAIGQVVAGTKIAGKLASAVAKGSKTAKVVSKAGSTAVKAGKKVNKLKDVIRDNKPLVDKAIETAKRNKKLEPYMTDIEKSINELV